MKIASFTHIGQRYNQEDSLGYNNNSYIICDGMGGHVNGELASNFVTSSLLEKTQNKQINSSLDIEFLLEEVQQSMNTLLTQNPTAAGMGTTFAGIFATNDTIYMSHIGDSRIYYVKPNSEQFWHTWGHSPISFLVRNGEITREAGRLHPQNNRINKAIVANVNLKTVKPDITELTTVEKSDLFFICSDGVNEAWSDLELIKLLLSKKSIIEKLNTIKEKCVTDSKDNNTAILLEIEEQDIISRSNNSITMLTIEDLEIDFRNHLKNKNLES